MNARSFSDWAKRATCGSPRPLLAGKVDEPKLHRHAISEGDLKEALHAAGLEDMRKARLVVLEPSGKTLVLKDG